MVLSLEFWIVDLVDHCSLLHSELFNTVVCTLTVWILHSVPGEFSVKILVLPSPSGYMLWSFGFSSWIQWIFYRFFFKWWVNLLKKVLNFHQLFVKFNRFICNLAVNSPPSLVLKVIDWLLHRGLLQATSSETPQVTATLQWLQEVSLWGYLI